MPQGTTIAITQKFKNNSKTATTVSENAPTVVIDRQVVSDPNYLNAGVIYNAPTYT